MHDIVIIQHQTSQSLLSKLTLASKSINFIWFHFNTGVPEINYTCNYDDTNDSVNFLAMYSSSSYADSARVSSSGGQGGSNPLKI
jgi:hypothetical protein